MEDTHQILFGSANSFKSYCVHMKIPRTYVHPDIQTDRQTEIFFGLFCLLRHINHEHLSKGENFFFHSCDYNTFSFYILRMWWKRKKKKLLEKTKKNSQLLKNDEVCDTRLRYSNNFVSYFVKKCRCHFLGFSLL